MKRFLLVVVIFAVLFSMVACTEVTPKEPSSFEKQSQQNEEIVKDLVSRNELPKLTKSQDWDNVKRRAEYLNQGNNIGYLYLLTENGQLIKEVQVLGKVTSLNTYITPMEEIKNIKHAEAGYSSSKSETPVVVQAPDLDGTYGENHPCGIFWFTPDSVYQEWVGLYLFSSDRLSFTSQPLLIETVE